MTTITAHAGALGTKDNTLESIQTCLDFIGKGNIEVDVRFTPGGTPVLGHDAAEDGLFLSALFALAKDYPVKINLDMKEKEGNTAAIVELANAYKLRKRIFFTGIAAGDVTKVCALGIPYYINVQPTAVPGFRDIEAKRLVKQSMKLGAEGLNLHHRLCTKKLVDWAHDAGQLVSVWTVDEEDAIRRMLALGVDNLTTRRPDLALEIRESSILTRL
ncbi:MAG: glycerophosphodiester phosphodiesterase [Oscillospiraceae bacterium]|jgi:glycerophosphoryl diester phosphodiesterase|nr:glycerophosphodiester phosphodiesterase [Oscillospiraceae bacterium]